MNQKFNILKALGIIAVVGGHTGWSGGSLFGCFPVYSFHMALFIFISGYFFKPYKYSVFIVKKIKHLILPLIGWNIFYGFFTEFLSKYGYSYSQGLTLKNIFLEPFITGYQFLFNLATWFIGWLFFVQILYLIIYKIFKGKEMFIWLFVIVSYFVSLLMAYNISHTNNLYLTFLPVERALYGLIFYQLGFAYRNHLEKKDNFSFNKIIFLILLNTFIMTFINKEIGNMVVLFMNFPNESFFVPIIVSCSGIWLYLQLAELLNSKVKNNELISYIGVNTFSIMTHHLFFIWLFDTFIFVLYHFNFIGLDIFDYNKYTHEIYYRIIQFTPFANLIYMLIGLLSPIGFTFCYKKCKSYLMR